MGDSSHDSQYDDRLNGDNSNNITCNGSRKPGQSDNWRVYGNDDSGHESGTSS